MNTVHYLAYGSNLHPLRLGARVPSARVVGVVALPGYRLAFHKRSIDGSGKCLLYAARDPHHQVYGVLYEIDAGEKTALDRAEGKGGGYCEQVLQVTIDGLQYAPYLYAARASHIDPSLLPYHWYKRLVLAGARYHGFPAAYVAAIEATPSKPDDDARRRRENEALLLRTLPTIIVPTYYQCDTRLA
jgi:hypothetical protein